MNVGRHRGFDKESTLEQAMLVFWKKGYSGASLTDLTTSMGINKSSLYAAFGNKEKLFNQAIELYLKKHGVVHSHELFKPSVSLRERINNFLCSIAKMVTDNNLPKGCLICHSTSESVSTCLPEASVQVIQKTNSETLTALRQFLEKEQDLGHLNAVHSPETVANYILTLQFGLAVAAKNGSDFEALQQTIYLATAQF